MLTMRNVVRGMRAIGLVTMLAGIAWLLYRPQDTSRHDFGFQVFSVGAFLLSVTLCLGVHGHGESTRQSAPVRVGLIGMSLVSLLNVLFLLLRQE